MLYQLPERPPVTVVSPDNSEFWTQVHVAARGRHALILGDPTTTPAAASVVVGRLTDALLGGEDYLEVGDAEAALARGPADRDRLIAQPLASGPPKPGEWWQLWTGDRWDDLDATPRRPHRPPLTANRRPRPVSPWRTTMHTPALTFDPIAAEAWLREPSGTAFLTRAESLGVDEDTFGRGREGFLSTIDDVLSADPHALRRRADIAAVMFWLIPDGDVLDQGALITVDLSDGLRLASLHQDIKDFTDRDQRGIATCRLRWPTLRPGIPARPQLPQHPQRPGCNKHTPTPRAAEPRAAMNRADTSGHIHRGAGCRGAQPGRRRHPRRRRCGRPGTA